MCICMPILCIYLIIIEVIFLCLHHTMIISNVSELSFRATALNLCVDNCYIFNKSITNKNS